MSKLKVLMATVAVVLLIAAGAPAQFFLARDPGVRGGPAGAGKMLDGLTPSQATFFAAAQEEFEESDTLDEGLGPRFNLDGCAGCHSQPATGGPKPAEYPQGGEGGPFRAPNHRSSFLTLHRPVGGGRLKDTAVRRPHRRGRPLLVLSDRHAGAAD